MYAAFTQNERNRVEVLTSGQSHYQKNLTKITRMEFKSMAKCNIDDSKANTDQTF